MGTLRVTGVAGRADPLPGAHALTDAHTNITQVCIHCGVTVPMIDLDHVAIAEIAPARHRHYAAIGRIDRRAFAGRDVDPEVPGPVIISRERMTVCRPGKATAAHRTA